MLTISALASLLFHWGVLQRVTGAFAWLLRRLMGIGGALGAGRRGACLRRHDRGAVAGAALSGAHAAGRVVRADDLRHGGGRRDGDGDLCVVPGPFVPNALGNILIASIISTPAGAGGGGADGAVRRRPTRAEAAAGACEDAPLSSLDALVKGTMDGVPILAASSRSLLVTVALVTLVNMALGLLPDWDGAAITLQRLFALPFRPVMWLIGVPWAETGDGGDADGDQDRAERVRGLSEFLAAAGWTRSRRAAA